MIVFKRIAWAISASLVCALLGCDAEVKPAAGPTVVADGSNSAERDADQSKTNSKEPDMTQTVTPALVVSKTNEANVRVKLGTLQFDESSRPKLLTEGSGPDVEKLKKDWQEISSKPELDWEKTVPEEVNGKTVKKIISDPTRPGDPTYIYAVYDELTREYGYTVGIVD
jgi:hypothetical protein